MQSMNTMNAPLINLYKPTVHQCPEEYRALTLDKDPYLSKCGFKSDAHQSVVVYRSSSGSSLYG